MGGTGGAGGAGEPGEALAPGAPRELPAGTVTFLFTDLEGSTRLLEAHPAAYRNAVRRHHDLLRSAVEGHGGVVFETVGDAVYAAFAQATDAVAAALAGQLALRREDWGALGEGALRARMGLHTGEVVAQGGHYFGAPLYRAGRLLPAAHGGQVVLTGATAELIADALPAEAALHDLGEHRLRDLARPVRVFQLGHPDLPAEFPPLRTLDALPHNLPLQLTSFVGREREQADVRRLLDATRLLTLTGPGGTGKTRLALQVAADALEAHPDGVWLAELGALADPALVPQAVAAAVGVREEPGRPLVATLTDALRPKRLLLVLDNCEHLLDACARLADALLRACPHATVLATSREALGIAGETAWRVPSLSLPAPRDAEPPLPPEALTRYEAVRLFVDRAVAAQPAFRVTAQNAPAVVQVCRRLDGIPLALELAAARVRVLPPVQLLGRLEDRFRLLTGGSRTALERHQTLQATVDWSYDLLSAQEQTLFDRLSVFAGGWTLEAAEHVCASGGVDEDDVLDLLTRLVDKSLVLAEEAAGGVARYRLLETLRQYGQHKLAAAGAAAPLRGRHAGVYLALAEALAPDLPRHIHSSSPASLDALDRLEAEHDNLRAALACFEDDARSGGGDAPPGAGAGAGRALLRLVAALWRFWDVRGYGTEGRRWLAAALAAAPSVEATPAAARDPERRRLLAARATALVGAGQPPRLQEALAIRRVLGDAAGTAEALFLLSGQDRERAQALLDESLALWREAGDRPGEAVVLNRLGFRASQRGELAEAHRLVAQALAIRRRLGDQLGTANSLTDLGHLARARGDLVAARTSYAESVTLRRAFGPVPTAQSLGWLASVHLAEGELAPARERLEEALALLRGASPEDGRARGLEAWWTTHLGAVLLAQGDVARAGRAARREPDLDGSLPARPAGCARPGGAGRGGRGPGAARARPPPGRRRGRAARRGRRGARTPLRLPAASDARPLDRPGPRRPLAGERRRGLGRGRGHDHGAGRRLRPGVGPGRPPGRRLAGCDLLLPAPCQTMAERRDQWPTSNRRGAGCSPAQCSRRRCPLQRAARPPAEAVTRQAGRPRHSRRRCSSTSAPPARPRSSSTPR